MDVDHAARALESGQLVVFPTETVYGLGANALDPKAVDRVFEVKGREFTRPLALHVASLQDALPYVKSVPEALHRLEDLLPGPLMIIVPRAESLPGGPTVGIRVPDHPIAQALLRACKVPVLATSANRSGRPTATRLEDVQEDLGDAVEVLLGSEHPLLGLESTVLDLTVEPARVLRAGACPRATIEARLGYPIVVQGGTVTGRSTRSIEVVPAAQLPQFVGPDVAALVYEENVDAVSGAASVQSAAAGAMGQVLFGFIRDAERQGWSRLVVEAPAGTEAEAVCARLQGLGARFV